MVSPIVLAGSSGATTNPDQRQRLVTLQSALRRGIAPPKSQQNLEPPQPHQQVVPSPSQGIPIFEGEVGFTTSLIAQRLGGDTRKFSASARSSAAQATLARLRDFLV